MSGISRWRVQQIRRFSKGLGLRAPHHTVYSYGHIKYGEYTGTDICFLCSYVTVRTNYGCYSIWKMYLQYNRFVTTTCTTNRPSTMTKMVFHHHECLNCAWCKTSTLKRYCVTPTREDVFDGDGRPWFSKYELEIQKYISEIHNSYLEWRRCPVQGVKDEETARHDFPTSGWGCRYPMAHIACGNIHSTHPLTVVRSDDGSEM